MATEMPKLMFSISIIYPAKSMDSGVVDEFMAILSLKMPCTPMITVEAMAMTVVMTK